MKAASQQELNDEFLDSPELLSDDRTHPGSPKRHECALPKNEKKKALTLNYRV